MKTPIVILHGWRKRASDYDQLRQYLEEEGYLVFVPDLPGNPEQKLTKAVMYIDDYVDWLKKYLDKKHIKKAIFICHSFGGRVIAKFIVHHSSIVEKLILTGTPLIKQRLSLKRRILVIFSRVIKRLLIFSFGRESMRKILYYLIGEWDYYKVPKEIKDTFNAILRENNELYLPLIKVKTLVLWGNNDTFVPKSVGKKIALLIPNAKYKEMPGTHKLPYEKPEEFSREVLEFIRTE